MIFGNKEKEIKDTFALNYIAKYLETTQNEMVSEELATLDIIDSVKKSFRVVLSEADTLKAAMTGFQDEFAQVKTLADNIKGLVGDVNKSVEDIESNTAVLSDEIAQSQEALTESIGNVERTNDTFQQICDKADSITDVQENITTAITQSNGKLYDLSKKLDIMTGQYDNVMNNMNALSMRTTKKKHYV